MKQILPIILLLSFQLAHSQSGILQKAKEKLQEKMAQKKTEEAESTEETAVDTTVQESQDKSPVQNDIAAYRKFNFVRGANLIFADAFEDEIIGDYPKRWMSDAGGEIVTLNTVPGKWLRGTEAGNHGADFLQNLPLNFTLEFDVISDAKKSGDYNILTLKLVSTKGGKNFSNANSQADCSGFNIDFDFYKPWLTYSNQWYFGNDSTNQSFVNITSPANIELESFNFNGKPLHISILRQDSRLVMYINTTRMFDIRNAFAKSTILNNLIFKTESQLEDKNSGLYFSNVVLAETVSDTRKDMFIDGKYVTNAILFETNSDKLLPTSLSAITLIADYLKNNPSVKLKVVGHTDNVGEVKANQTLSVNRANSVVKELVGFHKIEAARLVAEGMGASKPITDNSTAEGKAKNRRVEFIKF